MGPNRAVQSSPHKTCEFCGRAFARNEHLIRHRRTHTSERPFECPHCELSFPRSDVKDRHVERHHAPDEENSSFNGLKRKRPSGSGGSRSKLACDECRRRKLKCDNMRPCEGCKSRDLPCTVSSNSRPPGRPRGETSNRIGPQNHDRAEFTATSIAEASNLVTPISQVLSSHRTESCDNGFDPSGEQSDQTLVGTFNGAVITDTAMNEYEVPALDGPDDLGGLVQDWESMDFMDGFWQLPQMAGDTWLDDLDPGLVGGEFLAPPVASMNALPSTSMQSAIDLMRNYFQGRSRAPSPSAGEATQMWYSRQPRLQIYDKDIVNVFLNLARRHLASSFAIVAKFDADTGSSEELCLAVAAVGGLFCDVPGSMNIAKALCNDSRRILHENVSLHPFRDINKSINLAKTFIILEIYGLCSGDKRIFELAEAFHASLLQEWRYLNIPVAANMTVVAKKETSLILEALHVLDCYRAILLLQPPTFLPLYNKELISAVSSRSDIDDWADDLSNLLTPVGKIDRMKNSMVSLAAISCFSYMSGGRQTLYTDQPLWRSEFTEIALDRWFQAQSQPLDLSKLLIYHMTHINIHADLALLQRFAQSLAKSRRSLSEENAQIHAWITSEHFKSARWHAERILAAVTNEIAKCRRTGRTSLAKRDRPEQTFENVSVLAEPPHLPYCVYFSILIVWYQARYDDGNPAGWSSCINGVVPLLFGLRSGVAKLLGNALIELKTFDP